MLLLEDKLSIMAKEINEVNIYVDDLYIEDGEYVYASDCLYGNNNLRIDNGMSKLVLIDKSSSFVLKMPIFGEKFQEWDEENYEYLDDYYTEDYSGADSEYGNNYCEDELKKYEKAVEEGFSEFFPKTYYYGKTNHNIPLYAQERVNSWDYWDNQDHISDNSKSIAKNVDTRLPKDFLAACLDFYGFKRTMEFVTWLKDNREYTSDLHNGNLGKRKNGAPVILDFSGFDC